MKINLNVKIPIEIQENGKTKEKLEVFYRDYTKDEKKEFEKIVNRFRALFKKALKIEQKEKILSKKIELSEKSEDYKQSLKYLKEQEKLQGELNALAEEIEGLGGDAFEEKMSKKRFDTLLSGKDKEKLREYTEAKGYEFVMNAIDAQRTEIEKKHLGE